LSHPQCVLGASPDTAEEPAWCTPSTGHDACTMGDEPAVFVREALPARGALPRPANRTADGDRPGAAPGHLGQDRARRPAASPTIYRGMFMARVGIVTGAASGIGQALATALVNRGDTVVLADVNADGAKQVAAGLRSRASAVGLDVRDADKKGGQWTAL